MGADDMGKNSGAWLGCITPDASGSEIPWVTGFCHKAEKLEPAVFRHQIHSLKGSGREVESGKRKRASVLSFDRRSQPD